MYKFVVAEVSILLEFYAVKNNWIISVLFFVMQQKILTSVFIRK